MGQQRQVASRTGGARQIERLSKRSMAPNREQLTRNGPGPGLQVFGASAWALGSGVAPVRVLVVCAVCLRTVLPWAGGGSEVALHLHVAAAHAGPPLMRRPASNTLTESGSRDLSMASDVFGITSGVAGADVESASSLNPELEGPIRPAA